MSNDVHVVTYLPGDPGGDDKKLYILKAPSDAQGGGIRIVDAWIVNRDTAALSQGVGGTTFTVALHKYSSAATPVVNGTIAPAVGGTAEGWTANVVKTFTLNEAYTFLDAGEWLVGQYNEVNAGNPVGASIVVHYKMGR